MIGILICILVIFVIAIVLYIFEVAFLKGEIFDVTKKQPKKGGKLDEYLQEVIEGIEYIKSLESTWHYTKSVDGLKLAGRFFRKENSNKIIILFHGYRSIAENDFAAIFKWYYEAGYNILLVDQRSHGRSEGKFITFGVKERHDCLTWCEFALKEFPYIEEIILGGMSMGTTTILMATSLNLPSKVKLIIADCGFTSPKDIITRVGLVKYGLDVTIILPIVNILCRIFAKFNIYECSAVEAMKTNKIPVLFIHGLGDDFVPCSMSRKNHEACNAAKKLVLVDCVNHGFSYLHDKKRVQTEILDFINNN